MNRNFVVTALFQMLSLVALTACSSSGGEASGSAAGSGKPAAAPAAKCAAGEWAEPNGKLCIKLPAGWEAGEIRVSDVAGYKQTDMSFKIPDGGGPNWTSASFYYRDAGKGDYEAGLSSMKLDAEQAAKDKSGTGMEQEGNVSKGTGKYFVYRDVNKSHTCFVQLLSGETHVVLKFSTKSEKTHEPEVIAACKSAYMP